MNKTDTEGIKQINLFNPENNGNNQKNTSITEQGESETRIITDPCG